MAKIKKTITIGIPVFNEEDIIPELYARLAAVRDRIKDKYSVRFLFIDDGSRDSSLDLLIKISKKDKDISVISFSRNFGLEAAISCIIEKSMGDALIIIDGDLQDPPELIPDLIQKWEEGFDVIYTVKRSRKEVWHKKLLIAIFYKIQNLVTNIRIPIQSGNFSLIDSRVVSQMRKLQEKNKYFPGLRAWCGFKQYGLYYDRDDRLIGKPRQTFGKLMNLAISGIFSYTKAPQKIAYFIGLLFIIIGFLYIIYAVVSKFVLGIGPVGWASTIMTIYLIGGFQIFIIALLGEYIIHIYDDTRKRPEYLIDREINKSK